MLSRIMIIIRKSYHDFLSLDSKEKIKFFIDIFVRYELFILKWSILLPLKLLHWSGNTNQGYFIMILITLGIVLYPYPLNLICACLYLDPLLTAAFCIIMAQMELGRELLKGLIGEDNFEEYIGSNPASKIGNISMKHIRLGAGIIIGKFSMDVIQSKINCMTASDYAFTCRKEGISINPEKFHAHFDKHWVDPIISIIKGKKK